jgi:hypothetical protein
MSKLKITFMDLLHGTAGKRNFAMRLAVGLLPASDRTNFGKRKVTF